MTDTACKHDEFEAKTWELRSSGGQICSSKYQGLTAVDSLYLWVHTFATDVIAKAMDNTWTDSQEYRDYTTGERVLLAAGNASCQSLNAATYHIQNLTLRIALLIHKGESRHSQPIMKRTFLYRSTFAFSHMVTDLVLETSSLTFSSL
ncbi:hypothetical protein I7I48_10136 [Histoplasma ohiense]|nr:hypothetical protein I7I48_10136 [Histoplasma ohiense (nom. inval.)]